MRAPRIAAGALVVAAAAALAQTPQPAAFGGLALGSSEARWKAAFPQSMCDSATDRAFVDRMCLVERGTAFGDVAFAQAWASFIDDRLVRILVVYAPGDADRVTDALKAVYGAPVVQDVSVINRRGTTVPNAVARWVREDGTIENRRIGATLEQAALTYAVPDYVALTQRRQLEALKPLLPATPER